MKHGLKKYLSIVLVAAIMICSASLTGLADAVTGVISTQGTAAVAPNHGALDRYKNPVWTPEKPCPTVVAKDETLSDDWFVYGLKWHINDNPDYVNVYDYIRHYIAVNGNYDLINANDKFDPYIGTGAVIDIYNGSDNGDISENYYIVIFGDVNGDTLSTMNDVVMIEDEIEGITHWSDPESEEYEPYKVKASDMDKNGKIDLFDYCVVSGLVLGVYFVDQRTGIFFDDNESLYTLLYYYDSEPYNDIKVFQLPNGTEVEEPIKLPQKDGYIFNGWLDYETGEPLDPLMPARDVVAYPSWISEDCEHCYTSDITTPPTCEGEGVKTYTCSECGDSYTEAIPAPGHDLGEWIVTVEPTCTIEGEETSFCEICGVTLETRKTPMSPHSPSEWETIKEPTCTEKGKRELRCTVCDAVLETIEIPVLGHLPCYCDWEWNPNCDCYYCGFDHPLVVPEFYHVRCYFCGAVLETKPNPNLCDHEEGEWIIEEEPTCKADGIKFKSCINCNVVMYEEAIPATGHKPGEWITTVEPTCTEKGEQEIRCTVCDAVLETTVISELDHVAPEPEPKPPVCGVETFKILCVRCGLQEIVYVPHVPGEWVVISEPTETTPGEEVCCCEICGEILETREIPPLEHTHKIRTVTIPATCTVAGMEYDICETCGERIGEARVIPATDHKPGSWVVSVEPDCENEGEKVCNCSVCGAICATETIPAKGHTPGEWEIVTESTAETEGKKIKKCVVCGKTIEEEIIPKKTVLTDDDTDVGVEIDGDDYDGNVEIVVSESFDGSAFNVVNTETQATRTKIYDIKITVNGEEVQPGGKVRVRMPLPDGYDESRTFVYHVDTSTGIAESMKAVVETINGKKYLVFETTHFSYYAIVEEGGFTMKIRNPSITTIQYGDSIILHADIEGELPSGYTVEWTASNGNFGFEDDGITCEITPEKTGDTVFTATVYDAKGNEVIKDEVTMTAKAGFFDKVIGFFKKLFGKTKRYPNVFTF